MKPTAVLLVLAMAAASLVTARTARAQDDDPEVASPDDIAGEVAIDLRDDASEADVDNLSNTLGIHSVPSSFLSAHTRIFVASVASGDVLSIIRKLRSDPRVEAVEPVALVHASWVPNDPLLNQQWHLTRVGAESAWSYSTGRGVTVAVIDTGIACEDHGPYTKGTDLAQTWCVPGFNFVDKGPHANDDHGHGTHVAGTIAQSTNNGLGAAGLAFNARLMPVKVLSSTGSGTTVAVADGIRFAADAGAQVINMSLGGSRASRLIRSAIDYARSKGVVIVAAAGNNGSYVEYPAAFDGVIAVSATDPSDKIAPFSSRGKAVDIAAPGVGVIQQTVCNGGRNKCERFPGFSGTSMASPHVAGAAALLISTGVTNPSKVESILLDNARRIDGQSDHSPLYGAGLLNIGAALSRTVMTHAATRAALLVALTIWVATRIRRKHGIAKPWRPGFILSALVFGPGLLCLVSLFASRVPFALDLLARPVGDWDILISANLHRWLPFANFFIPLGLSAIAFGSKPMRPIIAGASLGTAAYLLSLPILGTLSFSLRAQAILVVFVALNVLGCLWLAHLSMDEKPSD